MKLIFITPPVFPRMSPNTKCVLKIAQELTLRGYQVLFISISDKEGTFEKDSIAFHLVPMDRSLASKFFSLFPFKVSPKVGGYLSLIAKAISLLGKLIEGRSHDQRLVSKIKVEIEKHCEGNDILIPICFPIEACLAGNEVKKNNNDIKVYPYLLDLFTDSFTAHRLNFLKAKNYHRNLMLENEILKNCDSCFSLSTWDDWIKKSHPKFTKKSLTLNLPLLNRELYEPLESCNNSFLISGMLSTKARNPECALLVFTKLLENNKSFMMNIYHTGDCSKIIKKYSSSTLVDCGSVSEDVALNALKSAKYLVIIGNNDTRQVQSKVFEFISTGKPIIFFYKSLNDPILHSLKKYDNVCYLDESLQVSFLQKKLQEFIDLPYRFVPLSVIIDNFCEYSPKAVADEFCKGVT